MRRRAIMVKLPGRQYVSRFQHDDEGDMMKSKCYMSVRQRGVGPESREHYLGVFRVKKLKPTAFAEPKFIPGTFKKFKGT